MIQFINTPWIVKKWYPSLIWRKESDHTIYLTFDDGPHPKVTRWVMDQLKQVKAKATFFCLGEHLKKNPDVAKELVQNGHRLGNHSFSHLKGWETADGAYLKEVEETEGLIEKMDSQNGKLFRPPYGRIKKSQIRKLKSHYDIIMWSHLAWDFDSNKNYRKTIKKLKKAKSGSIIVFHDSVKAFDTLQKMLPELLIFYSKKGFKFETL